MTCFSNLIGVEFEYGSRGPDTYDCWGLVRECYRRWHGLILPDYSSSEIPAVNSLLIGKVAASHWMQLESPEPGAVIVMRFKGYGGHVGFVHTTTRFLHATEEVGVQEARLNVFRQQIIGTYAYAGQRTGTG